MLALFLAIAAPPVLAQQGGAAAITSSDPKLFASEMDRAMARMHEGMAAAKPTGNPDRDFAAMMIPHHQGAIDMAEIQLRFGRDERLRRLAQGIIVEQRQEIAVMQRILDETPAPKPAAAPAQSHTDHSHMETKP
ncbi:CopM family metallochaperone [Bosea thiooxidans]